MKGKQIIFVLALMVVMSLSLTTLVMARWQEPKPEFVWKCQSAWPRGSGLHYLQMRSLDFIENWTHGRVKFERYSANEIVPGYETWKAVERGIIPCGLACTCYTMSRSWATGMYCSAPGMGPVEKLAFYHGTPHVQETKDYRTEVFKLLEELVGKHFNVVVLPSALQTTETFLYSQKPINSIEDLKKLKIRSVGVRGDVFKYAGCTVVGMPAGEVIPAMERGVIDACEFANFFGDIPLGFADACKYIYFNPYSSSPCNLMMIFNKKVWQKIPDDLKKKIREACFESMKWSLAECLMLDFLAMKKVEKVHKAKVSLIPMEVGKYIHQKAMEYYAKKRKEDKELDQYMKYHDEFFAPDSYGKYVKFIKSLL